jgi:hypothetical protein
VVLRGREFEYFGAPERRPAVRCDRAGEVHRACRDREAPAARGPADQAGASLESDGPKRVTGNPLATKIDIAEVLVASGFDQLKSLIPKRPKRAALGLRPRTKYWLHMFGAPAIVVATPLATPVDS